MTTSIIITIIIYVTMVVTMTVISICGVIEQKYKYLYNHKHEEKIITLLDTDGREHAYKIDEDGYLKECEGEKNENT